ncbi:MAG: selenium metabolism-associated LysR family transcriptional regulator [Geobacteraceae bacterium]|jgi:DNA-binding transcriptional LysR family regulator
MNLKQLEVFVAVADSSSFSRAAEMTLLTQSTVSQHISSLESEFALKLLDRTGKGALLTEAGKLLLLHARRLIEEARDIPVVLNRFKGLEEAVLKIGGSNIPGSYMIPFFIPLFHQKNPGVTITLFQGDSRETLERLRREEVELAIIGSRFDGEEFVYTSLTIDKISLVVNSNHRWNGRESILPADIVNEPLIFREPGSGTDRTVRDALAAAGFAAEQLNVKTYLGSNEAVKQAILGGAGISFVSEMSVKKECERGELFMVKIEGVDISRSFYLVSRLGRELSPAAGSFVSLVMERFHSEGKG